MGSTTVTIKVPALPTVDVDGYQSVILGLERVPLTALVTGTGPFLYEWGGDGSYDDDTAAAPQWSPPSLDTGETYLLSLTVTDVVLQRVTFHFPIVFVPLQNE